MILLNVTFAEDFDRTELLLWSLRKYADDYIMYIVVNDELETMPRAVEKFADPNVILLHRDKIPAWQRYLDFLQTVDVDLSNGWITQQICKLGFAEYIGEKDYLIFDSKIFAINPVDWNYFGNFFGGDLSLSTLSDNNASLIAFQAYAKHLDKPEMLELKEIHGIQGWPFLVPKETFKNYDWENIIDDLFIAKPKERYVRTDDGEVFETTMHNPSITPMEYSLITVLLGAEYFKNGNKKRHRTLYFHDTVRNEILDDITFCCIKSEFIKKEELDILYDILIKKEFPVKMVPAKHRGTPCYSIVVDKDTK